MTRNCIHEKCTARASYGYKGNTPKYCKKHMFDNMINLLNPICKVEGCTVRASFGHEKSEFCKSHKTEDMNKLIKTRKCAYKDCNILPVFGYEGKPATFCIQHKLSDMINLVNKTCLFQGCTTSPIYGYDIPLYCVVHKEDSMTNLVSKTCKLCNKQPTFGYEYKKPTHCIDHKEDGMTDVRNKRCAYEGCNKQPNYNYKNEKAMYCSGHKLEGMIDVSNKRCQFEGCDLIPVFGNIGDKKASYCVTHKEDAMVNVSHKTCLVDTCMKQPAYGFDKPEYCSKHKQQGMINLIVKLCEYESCQKQPVYGYEHRKPRFCKEHMEEGMTNVKDKLCIIDGCKTRANFNWIGKSKEYCAKHKSKGMVLDPTKKCESCNNLAIYNRLRCEIHKHDNDENIAESPCESCGLPYILNEYQLCEYCRNSNSKLAKQNGLMNYLDSRKLYGILTDKVIDNGICGKERPDRVYDFGDKIIVLECDENQHSGRNCVCEQTRMVNICQSFGGLPVYFIRFNPDKYKSNLPSPLSKRYKLCGDLIEEIKYNRRDMPKALLSVTYLYFDNFNGIEWSIIQGME